MADASAWDATLRGPDDIAGAHRALARGRLGWLARQGFIGAFGFDFLLDGKDVYPPELHPRLQSSTGLLGQWELARQQVPLIDPHTLGWAATSTCRTAKRLPARWLPAGDRAGCALQRGRSAWWRVCGCTALASPAPNGRPHGDDSGGMV